MVVKNNNKYRSLAKFWYKNKHYHMFANDQNKLAFLIIDDEGKYHYPELRDLLEVTAVLNTTKPIGMQEIVKDGKRKPKKFSFIPKAITATSIIAISATLLATFNFKDNTNDANKQSKITYESEYTQSDKYGANTPDIKVQESKASETQKERPRDENYQRIQVSTINVHGWDDEEDEHKEQEQSSEVQDNKTSTITVNNKSKDSNQESNVNHNTDSNVSTITVHGWDEDDDEFASLLAAADDEYDYQWASDYYFSDSANLYVIHDSKGYSTVYDYSKPTYNDLAKVIDKNKDIPKKYKSFIKEYIQDWLTKYPDTDFSNFYYNLQTLKMIECTQEEIMWSALSPNAIACYRPNDNAIYINEKIDISDRSSDDYIVLAHELTHPARTGRYQIDKDTVYVSFFQSSNFGSYTDEALVTDFVYELQGENKRSTFYTLASSYYRIILDCLGSSYNGDDYMNHSINYLAQQMDNYMGDEGYALHIISLIDTQMSLHYNKYVETDVDSFEELFDYIERMYMKKYLKAGMSKEEAEQVFNNFMYEITFNFENLSKPYDEINEEAFRPTFDQCCNDLHISVEKTR